MLKGAVAHDDIVSDRHALPVQQSPKQPSTGSLVEVAGINGLTRIPLHPTEDYRPRP